MPQNTTRETQVVIVHNGLDTFHSLEVAPGLFIDTGLPTLRVARSDFEEDQIVSQLPTKILRDLASQKVRERREDKSLRSIQEI